MPKSAYIHIPFCKSKCKYCTFISFNKPELMTGYIYSLLKEITENYAGESLDTLYFGGGTPSLIKPELIEKIIKKFSLSSDCEITLEINPDDTTVDYINDIKSIGINRLSIGSQTFNDQILEQIGRRHNSKQIIQTVEMAKGSGFDNISVDLIYGLPNQDLNNLKTDLEKFLNLNIQHISTYGLKIEDGSYFGKYKPDNLPDEDIQADMYEFINKILENNGFYRYEISNFSKKGFESKHNINYWNNEEYYGFGVSAHGYVDGIRYSNVCNIEQYMEKPLQHEYGKMLTQKEKLEEEIFLGFRKTEGINTKKINSLYGINFEQKYKSVLDKYSDYLEKTTLGYKLNLQGTLLSNIILSEFL